jgi:hypothetical protein
MRPSHFPSLRSLFAAVALLGFVSVAPKALADDVVFLIDTSFSMATEDDGQVPRYKRAIDRAMEDVKFHLNSRDSVIVVLFDSVAHPPVRLRTVEEAKLFFRDYEPSGDTNIIDALIRAFRELNGRSRPLVYLYTDGEQTEKASLDWQQLVGLYNEYNASMPEENRIRLYYIKWKGCKPNTETDRWLRQIQNTTELQSKGKEWGEVEKISFRPDDLNVSLQTPETPGSLTTALPLRVEMTEKARARGLRFRIEASFPELPETAVSVNPASIDASAVADDGSFGAEMSLGSTAGLESFRTYALEVKFTVEGTSFDPKLVHVSPENGVIRGSFSLTQEPAFALVTPAEGRFDLGDIEDGKPVERTIELTWNRGANGKRIECLATFPDAAPADLFVETDAGREPILGGVLELSSAGRASVVARIAPREFAPFDGMIRFRGFDREETVRVSHVITASTVTVSPAPFETALEFDPDRGPSAGARSSGPLAFRFEVPAEARRLNATLALEAALLDAALEVTPSTVRLADLPADGSFSVVLALPPGKPIEAAVPHVATFTFRVDSVRGSADYIRLEPAGGKLAGTITLVEEAALLATLPNGGDRIRFPAVDTGRPAETPIEIRWNSGANGREATFDLEGDPGLSSTLAIGTGAARKTLDGRTIRLDDTGRATLTLAVTGSEKRPYGGRLKLSAFGREREIFFETIPAPGLVAVETHASLRGGLTVSPESEVAIDGAFTLKPASVNALSAHVSVKFEAPPGVVATFLDAAGNEIAAGKSIPLAGVSDVTTPIGFRARVGYDAFRAAGASPRIAAKIVFAPAAGTAVQFEGGASTFTFPLEIAIRVPEVVFERKGSPLVAVSLGDTDTLRAGDAFVVPFTVATRNVDAAFERRFDDESVRLEYDGPADVAFRCSGGPTATLGEIVKTPGLVIREKSAPFTFDLVQPLGSVRFSFASCPVRLSPGELQVSHDRTYRLTYAMIGLVVLAGGFGGFFVMKRKAPKVAGTLVIERAAAGTASARRRFELDEFGARAIEVGLTGRGDVQAEPALQRGTKVFVIRAKKGGRVLVPLAEDRTILVDEEPVGKAGSFMHDMCMIEFDGYRIRYVSGVDDEEIVILDDDDEGNLAPTEADSEEAEIVSGDEEDLSNVQIDEDSLHLDAAEDEERDARNA